MTVVDVTVPSLGIAMTEAVIAEYLVQVGDTVSAGQDLVLIETDKAMSALPSPVEGSVTRLIAVEGDEVPVGGLILQITTVTEPGEGATADSIEKSVESRPGASTQSEGPAVTVDVVVPSSGIALSEVYVESLHVELGSSVTAGSPIATIETDKAVLTIEAPCSGIIAAVFVGPGEECAVGRPIATIHVGERGESAEASQREATQSSPPTHRLDPTLTVPIRTDRSASSVNAVAPTPRGTLAAGFRPHTLGPRGRSRLVAEPGRSSPLPTDSSRPHAELVASDSPHEGPGPSPQLAQSLTPWVRVTYMLEIPPDLRASALPQAILSAFRQVASSEAASRHDLALMRHSDDAQQPWQVTDFVARDGAIGLAAVIDCTTIALATEVEVEFADCDVTVAVAPARTIASANSVGLSMKSVSAIKAKYRLKAGSPQLVAEIIRTIPQTIQNLGAP